MDGGRWLCRVGSFQDHAGECERDKESQSCGIGCVGRDLQRPPSAMPCCVLGHLALDQVAQDFVEPQGLCKLTWQPVPLCHQPQTEMFLTFVDSNTDKNRFKTVIKYLIILNQVCLKVWLLYCKSG